MIKDTLVNYNDSETEIYPKVKIEDIVSESEGIIIRQANSTTLQPASFSVIESGYEGLKQLYGVLAFYRNSDELYPSFIRFYINMNGNSSPPTDSALRCLIDLCNRFGDKIVTGYIYNSSEIPLKIRYYTETSLVLVAFDISTGYQRTIIINDDNYIDSNSYLNVVSQYIPFYQRLSWEV